VVYYTESKLQGWRAVAVFEDGAERLIYLGRSTTQVRAGYAAAYAAVLDDDERARVRAVSLECWDGAPDAGRWVEKATLAIPARKPLALSPGKAAEGDPPGEPATVLPFRGPGEATGRALVPLPGQ
jgi:hypothetical protein